MDIKLLGPEYAAKQLHREGQGLESNPYPKSSKEYESFYMEMHKLQHQELKDLIFGDRYAT